MCDEADDEGDDEAASVNDTDFISDLTAADVDVDVDNEGAVVVVDVGANDEDKVNVETATGAAAAEPDDEDEVEVERGENNLALLVSARHSVDERNAVSIGDGAVKSDDGDDDDDDVDGVDGVDVVVDHEEETILVDGNDEDILVFAE